MYWFYCKKTNSCKGSITSRILSIQPGKGKYYGEQSIIVVGDGGGFRLDSTLDDNVLNVLKSKSGNLIFKYYVSVTGKRYVFYISDVNGSIVYESIKSPY